MLIKFHYTLTFQRTRVIYIQYTEPPKRNDIYKEKTKSPPKILKKKQSLILHRRRHRFRRRRKLTPLPDLRAKFPKNNWNRDEDQSNAAEEGTSPIDTESAEHVHAEEGEDGSGEGSEEGVCCYC